MPRPDLETIKQAHRRILPFIRRTPVMSSRSIDEQVGAKVFFKCENFQRTGAFKYRGACNAVYSLSAEDGVRGVATHSSGNHGAALALAAKTRGIKATIVMPDNAVGVKRAAVETYGGIVRSCAPTMQSREDGLRAVVEETGAIAIPPFDHEHIIAGQGTAALELMDQTADLDWILTPVGGGGLLSGTAIVIKRLSNKVKVLGTEPAGADDAQRSFKAGHRITDGVPETVADGLRATIGGLTFPIIRDLVDDIVVVDEDAILRALRFVWERMKIVIEPSAAVPVAALLQKQIPCAGGKVGVILSGGNVDLDQVGQWFGGG